MAKDKAVSITQSSFDYQWKNIKKSDFLLDNPKARKDIVNWLLQETGLPKKWFKNKNILDVGCGQGRWSFAMLKLGAKVTAVDYTKSACEETKKNTSGMGNITILNSDVFELPKKLKNKKFDLVFSFGVLHHTGDTEKAFKTIAKLAKPEGYLYVYIYGKPKSILKRTKIFGRDRLLFPLLSLLPLSTQHKLFARIYPNSPHDAFDCFSPKIAHTHTEKEIRQWFESEGYDEIKRIYPKYCSWDKTDVHIIGRRK